jgi:hypothetical protein
MRFCPSEKDIECIFSGKKLSQKYFRQSETRVAILDCESLPKSNKISSKPLEEHLWQIW